MHHLALPCSIMLHHACWSPQPTTHQSRLRGLEEASYKTSDTRHQENYYFSHNTYHILARCFVNVRVTPLSCTMNWSLHECLVPFRTMSVSIRCGLIEQPLGFDTANGRARVTENCVILRWKGPFRSSAIIYYILPYYAILAFLCFLQRDQFIFYKIFTRP